MVVHLSFQRFLLGILLFFVELRVVLSNPSANRAPPEVYCESLSICSVSKIVENYVNIFPTTICFEEINLLL